MSIHMDDDIIFALHMEGITLFLEQHHVKEMTIWELIKNIFRGEGNGIKSITNQ